MSWRSVSARLPSSAASPTSRPPLPRLESSTRPGTHRRIVFGEVFGSPPRLTERIAAIRDALVAADIQAEAVADGRVPIWEKFIFLVSLAGFTGAARLPIGPILADDQIRRGFLDGCREIERIARAEGVPIAPDIIDRIGAYVGRHPEINAVVAADRSGAGQAYRGRAAAGISCSPRRHAPAFRCRLCRRSIGSEALGEWGTPIRLSRAWKSGRDRSCIERRLDGKEHDAALFPSRSPSRCVMASSNRPAA